MLFEVIRREVVGTVEEDRTGSKVRTTPIEAGYRVAARYLVENAEEGKPVAVEFTYNGHTFHAMAEPVPTPDGAHIPAGEKY